jgi:hypothetical protein
MLVSCHQPCSVGGAVSSLHRTGTLCPTRDQAATAACLDGAFLGGIFLCLAQECNTCPTDHNICGDVDVADFSSRSFLPGLRTAVETHGVARR